MTTNNHFFLNPILSEISKNISSKHLSSISILPDKNYHFSKKLFHFLNFVAFPPEIESFFSLSLSFNEQNLPKGLTECYQIVSAFITSFFSERFYFVIEGSFPQVNNESRFNIHILFTRLELPFYHNCGPWDQDFKLYCSSCKDYYWKLWNKGSIYISNIQTKEQRKKVFQYLSKMQKSDWTRSAVDSKNHSLISDYWTRIAFSQSLALQYASELVKLINNLSSPKKDSFERRLYKQCHQVFNSTRYNLLKLKSKLKKKILIKPDSKLLSKWNQQLSDLERSLLKKKKV